MTRIQRLGAFVLAFFIVAASHTPFWALFAKVAG
jgi:hypothetical protein